MTKEISIRDMQEHFVQHLDEVRRGVTLRLMEGDTIVAEIAPRNTDSLVYRPALKPWSEFVPPPPLETSIDVVALLREDRDGR